MKKLINLKKLFYKLAKYTEKRATYQSRKCKKINRIVMRFSIAHYDAALHKQVPTWQYGNIQFNFLFSFCNS